MGLFLFLYLYMSLQLLQQGGILFQPHEGLAQAGGQSQDAWSTGSLTLHELIQLITRKKQTETVNLKMILNLSD